MKNYFSRNPPSFIRLMTLPSWVHVEHFSLARRALDEDLVSIARSNCVVSKRLNFHWSIDL
jgi:hypothetical protein